MSALMRITLMSHSFVIDRIDHSIKPLLAEFARQNIQYTTEFRRGYGYIKKPFRVYAASTALRNEWRFHRHEYDRFVKLLKDHRIEEKQYKVRTREFKEPRRIDVTRLAIFQDRDYQIDLIEYLSRLDLHSKVVPLQTGKGKTYVAMRASENIGWRTGLITASRYLNQWKTSLKDTFGLLDTDVWIIRGNSELKKYIRQSIDKVMNSTYVLFSNTTLQVFIKKYEANPKKTIKEYGCHPEDLLELGGIGLKIVDEAHQNLHLNFKLDLYCHVPTTIFLSATLETEDNFVNRITDIIYPPEYRFTGIAYDCYIAAEGWYYRLAPGHDKKIRTTVRGRDSYSHSEFEKSILGNDKMKLAYFDMINQVVQARYVNKRVDKRQKCLVFCDLVEMCTELTEYIKLCNPHITVARYTADDEDENLYEPEIVVTTPGSCGTGKDVPNLMLVVMSNAIGGMQLNLQMLGRLRRLKDFEDVTPEFVYLICLDIDKHMEYHRKKYDVFRGKVLSHKDTHTNFVI